MRLIRNERCVLWSEKRDGWFYSFKKIFASLKFLFQGFSMLSGFLQRVPDPCREPALGL